jgi:uncharacterized protein
VYREEGVLARLDYDVVCDDTWITRRGSVRGWLDDRTVDVAIVRGAAGTWSLNDVAVPGLESCVDLDLGFTPATNTLQLRRVALAKGQGTDVPVAWLDVGAGTLTLLAQRYERRSESTYWYESPRFGYAALLELAPTGFVRVYPELWELER